MTAPRSALRRAALLLHAMAPADQAWLLASLSPVRRARLEDLLGELRSLGIPTDASLLQPAAETAATPPTPSAVRRLERLTGDELAWLACRLQDEPPELTARLLAHRAWPWRAALLEHFDASWRQSVSAAASQPRLPLPEAALCEALSHALAAEAPARQAEAGKRFWNRLRFVNVRAAAAR
jgi:hypothetical protein